MSDITDAVGRMREMNAALSDWDRIRAEGERISREEGYKVLTAEIATLHAEIDRLRLAIRRLAEQDATLSVQGGNVTVTVDATLTDEERKAVDAAATFADHDGSLMKEQIATLRGLLERMSGTGDCPAQDNTATQDNSQFAKREPDSPQAIADARLAALQQLAELEEELGPPRTPTSPSTPAECSVLPQCTEDFAK